MWTGAKTNKKFNNYGRFFIKPKCYRAHRISLEICGKKVPRRLNVLHKCDTTLCVNPKHLYIGTPADNARDRHKRGRDGSLKGEKNPASKLTEGEVHWIRKYAKPGHYPHGNMQKIANRFHISKAVIWDIYLRKRWTHI